LKGEGSRRHASQLGESFLGEPFSTPLVGLKKTSSFAGEGGGKSIRGKALRRGGKEKELLSKKTDLSVQSEASRNRASGRTEKESARAN